MWWKQCKYLYTFIWNYFYAVLFKELCITFLCYDRQTPPAPRFDHTAAVHAEHYLLIFGGCSHDSFFNDLHVLDLQTVSCLPITLKLVYKLCSVQYLCMLKCFNLLFFCWQVDFWARSILEVIVQIECRTLLVGNYYVVWQDNYYLPTLLRPYWKLFSL